VRQALLAGNGRHAIAQEDDPLLPLNSGGRQKFGKNFLLESGSEHDGRETPQSEWIQYTTYRNSDESRFTKRLRYHLPEMCAPARARFLQSIATKIPREAVMFGLQRTSAERGIIAPALWGRKGCGKGFEPGRAALIGFTLATLPLPAKIVSLTSESGLNRSKAYIIPL
jgi:hypothetical protein